MMTSSPSFTMPLPPSCCSRRSPSTLLSASSSFYGTKTPTTTTKTAVDFSGGSKKTKKEMKRTVRIVAMSASNTFKMNLNEYMVALEIRFAIAVDGKIFVHALKKGGNAEKSRIVMVGDTLKRAGSSSEQRLHEIKDFGDTIFGFFRKMLKENAGSYSLVLERPFTPFPIQQLLLMNDLDNLFNRGRVPFATWNSSVLASNLQSDGGSGGNSGFVTFSSKFLRPQGWNFFIGNGHVQAKVQRNTTAQPIRQLVCVLSEEEPGDGEWGYGNFPLEEYVKALDRSKGELYYDHSLGMRYSKSKYMSGHVYKQKTM